MVKHGAQGGDPHLQRPPGVLRRQIRPQLLDEDVDGDDVIGAHGEQGEQGALLRAEWGDLPVADEQLHRPEEPQRHILHRNPTVLAERDVSIARVRSERVGAL